MVNEAKTTTISEVAHPSQRQQVKTGNPAGKSTEMGFPGDAALGDEGIAGPAGCPGNQRDAKPDHEEQKRVPVAQQFHWKKRRIATWHAAAIHERNGRA